MSDIGGGVKNGLYLYDIKYEWSLTSNKFVSRFPAKFVSVAIAGKALKRQYIKNEGIQMKSRRSSKKLIG